MYEVNYHKAKDVKDAVKLMGKAEDGKLMSGGQTLIPTMKQRLAAPSDLVDISSIADLKGVKVEGSKITIGAATTHAEVASNKKLQKACSGIASLAGMIGDPHVRHKGTIGGSIANNDPAADYPSAMVALNASIKTNKRTLSADKFFIGMFETALNEGEVVVSVSFDKPKKSAYAKFPNPASRYAMAGVFVAKLADNSVRVGVTGAGADGVFRHKGMEKALSAKFNADALAGITVNEGDMLSDLHGDAAYRANLVKVMAKKAVNAAG